MKDQLRKMILNRLIHLKEEERSQQEQAILTHLLTSEFVQNNHRIACTISRYPELDTAPIIQALWRLGKEVVIPRTIRAGEMEFRLFTSYNQLEKRAFELLEPIEASTMSVLPSTIDAIIVPGVVFNQLGYRIGYGGGYYDRFLEHYEGETCSVVFTQQLHGNFSIEPHDCPVNYLVSATGWRNCKEER